MNIVYFSTATEATGRRKLDRWLNLLPVTSFPATTNPNAFNFGLKTTFNTYLPTYLPNFLPANSCSLFLLKNGKWAFSQAPLQATGGGEAKGVYLPDSRLPGCHHALSRLQDCPSTSATPIQRITLANLKPLN